MTIMIIIQSIQNGGFRVRVRYIVEINDTKILVRTHFENFGQNGKWYIESSGA